MNKKMILDADLLLETYNPGTSELAPRTAAFAATLADATPAAASSTLSVPTVESLRAAVTVSLADKSLSYPEGLTSHSYTQENIGGMDCTVLRAKHSASVPTLVMFYGGGFCLNTLFAHKPFMAHITTFIACNIILPDYPLAPETKAPESMAKSSIFLQGLLDNPTTLGFSEQIILMGWSSGAHMALTLALNLQQQAPPLFHKISQILLLSSWMDLSLTVARKGPYQAQQNKDTIAVGADILEIITGWYLPLGYTIDEPEYCPALRSIDELKALPPTTVIAGSCEVLLGDSIFIADALRRARAPVQLVVLEGQTHNYLVYDELSKDGVFVPELIGRIVTGQPIKTMVGTDGFGLTVNAFNINE